MNVINQKSEKEKLQNEKTLGEKIVEGRRKKRLSQEKFAEKIGCTRQIVSRWELDQSMPRTENLKQISSVLDISIEDLMGKTEEDENGTRKLTVVKFLNRKNIIKYVLIPVIIVIALYFLYSGYKLLLLNSIIPRIGEYKNVNNYHFIMETYIDQKITEKREVWYKDGLYKIIETYIVDNIESSSIEYIDINNEIKYVIDEQNKIYSQAKLFDIETYENGKYMYNSFPLELNKENNNFMKVSFKINKIFAYLRESNLYLIMNNEIMQLDKDTLLPISETIIMQENQNKFRNDIKYDIELNGVTENDVKVPSDYKKIN